ncbi:hypothetical protein CH063_05055, partial [Colletotrichum higginsianum]
VFSPRNAVCVRLTLADVVVGGLGRISLSLLRPGGPVSQTTGAESCFRESEKHEPASLSLSREVDVGLWQAEPAHEREG